MRRALALVAAIAAIAFSAGPFGWLVLASIRPEAEMTALGFPRAPTLASWRAVLSRPDLLSAFGNSVLVASITTVLALALAASAAFAVARLRFPGRTALLGVTLAVSTFPPIATVSPLYLLVRALGLLDRAPGLALPYTTFALPLAIWLLAGFFRDVPGELHDAARVDGCSPLQTLRLVFLPLSLPALATTAILVFVAAWNEFLWAVTFTSSPAQRTVPVAIALFSSEHSEPWGEIAAASVAATLPLLVLTLVLQRRIVAGLTAGAVKG